MKVVVVSDTHGQHALVNVPEGDVLIHAGDVSRNGKREQIEDFLSWFSDQPHQHKIFIAGNHDYFFERESTENIKEIIPENVVYLNDSGIDIKGLHFWGSPVQPWFFDWAFNRERGEEIKKHWDLIPTHTDVLITHGPVHGLLDKTISGEHVGCEELKNKVNEIQPKVSIAGHIHEAYGEMKQNGIHYINASVLNVNYELVNEPIIFTI